VYYNFAAGSFLSKLCSRLHSTEVDFYSKKRKSSLFEPPFGRLRGNVCTSSIACWKARVRLPIRHNWTFFASSYCWDVTGGNLSTWAIFEGRWVTSIAHFRWNGTSPTKHCWVAENYSVSTKKRPPKYSIRNTWQTSLKYLQQNLAFICSLCAKIRGNLT